jgi:putative two-component system response regulator
LGNDAYMSSGPDGISGRSLRSRILVVDDEPATVKLLLRLLEQWGFADVVGLTDPTEVAETVAGAPPDLLLLDLKMPNMDGFAVLEAVGPLTRGSTALPVLVLTADATPETKRAALAAGARDFINKPFDAEEIRLRVSNLLDTRHLQLALKEHGDELERRVRERTHALERAQLEVVERLAMAAEFRDDDTHRHAQRIGNTAALLGEELGVSRAGAQRLGRAAPLHDIGKIAVPDAILLKRGRLTNDEYDAVKEHTVVGARILSGSSSPLLQLAEEIAETHHEHWDGTGYPAGLQGEGIPLSGRIVAVADVFDALTHHRPYKDASPTGEAVYEIMCHSSTHFDPTVVAAFESLDHAALVAPAVPPHEEALHAGPEVLAGRGREPVAPGRFARSY